MPVVVRDAQNGDVRVCRVGWIAVDVMKLKPRAGSLAHAAAMRVPRQKPRAHSRAGSDSTLPVHGFGRTGFLLYSPK